MAANTNTLHVSVQLVLNDDNSWRWNDPKAQIDLQFDMPVEMFHSPSFTKMVENRIELLKADFKVIKAEAERAEAEKAKADAELEIQS